VQDSCVRNLLDFDSAMAFSDGGQRKINVSKLHPPQGSTGCWTAMSSLWIILSSRMQK